MVKRKGVNQHYENMFEKWLRENGILYIAIDETKKPQYDGASVKNFDFIVSSFNGKFLIDIKGKQFSYGQSGSWENWIRTTDISGLKLWASHFNAFTPLLVYPYLLSDPSHQELFSDVYTFRNGTYGVVAIDLATFYIHAKPRYQSWDAISVSRRIFRDLAKPVSHFIPELKKGW